MNLPCPSRAVLAAGIALLCLSAGPAHALDPRVPLDHLHHDAWTSKDGMPGDVWDMAQGADGTMWFATTSGLYRFDGVRFEHVRALGGAALGSNVLSALRTFPDGTLWIGHRYGGLDVWDGGTLRHYGADAGLPPGALRAIERDRAGRTWALASQGLLYLDGGRWRMAGPQQGLPGLAADLWRAPDGTLLVSDETAVYRLDHAALRFAPTGIAAAADGLLAAPDGAIWSDARQGLRRIPAALAPFAGGTAAASLPTARAHLFDRDGNLWAAGSTLTRTAPAALAGRAGVAFADGERLARPERLSSATVKTLLEDREGNLWLGTRRGVDRLRHDRLLPAGLPPESGYIGLALDAAGTPWIAAKLADRWGLWRAGADGLHAQPQPDGEIVTLASGADGALLLGGHRHIERRSGARTVRIPFPDAVRQHGSPYDGARLLLDDGPALWASFARDTLYRHADGAWRRADAFGLPRRAPNAIARDARGTVWVGYDNEVFALDGARPRRYGKAEGLDTGVTGTLYDAGGVLAIGGDRGLALLSGGRARPVEGPQPGMLAGVTGIVMTPDGDLWLNGSKGLAHVRAADWRALLADPGRTTVEAELFDARDGYPGIAHFRVGQPSLVLARDGRLLVAATDGAAWIDPRRLYRNRVAPPVRLRALAADGRALALRDGMVLPAGTRNLQIDYMAASFTMPERVRLRYRLEGVDAGWQDAGTRRSAYYNRLGPGDYRFRVQAVNEDGVWNEAGATLAFAIAPTFVQGMAFKVLCVAAALLAAWLLHRLRLRRATRQLRRLLRERANERERIARTLHDTLMQSVQALLMLFEAARDRLPLDSASRPPLDRALEQARFTLGEGRDELHALRGAGRPADDLAAALAPLGRMLGEQYGVRFDVAVHGRRRPLRAEVAKEACFIAREALQNAFRHARAAAVALELDYGADAFLLRVRDDGRGIGDAAARPGHWGVPGMRERAAAIGARIAIAPAPAPGHGTLVELRLDARAAYATAPRRRWARLAGWLRPGGAAGR
ncbi:sensor histidine kinase [uncultured Massilia sp.]|uniref:sensor histidine kinase n=1 Tax=uncultured Massilia sp. TaxID=169973 RepID=UPI0025ECCFD2|nr:sensor histidine kinase [uncultured Massilia sp.]